MKVSAYLIVTPTTSGNNYYPRKGAEVRIVKQKPKLRAKEIAFNMEISLPDALWERHIPTIELDVPVESILNPDQTVATKAISAEVAEALHLDVVKVEDGLVNLLKERDEAKDGETPTQ